MIAERLGLLLYIRTLKPYKVVGLTGITMHLNKSKKCRVSGPKLPRLPDPCFELRHTPAPYGTWRYFIATRKPSCGFQAFNPGLFRGLRTEDSNVEGPLQSLHKRRRRQQVYVRKDHQLFAEVLLAASRLQRLQ